MTDSNHFLNLSLSLFNQGSAADGPRGLSVGDIVTRLEECPVRGVEDWSSCLSHLSHTPQTGYCVPVASLQPSWAHGRRECAVCTETLGTHKDTRQTVSSVA